MFLKTGEMGQALIIVTTAYMDEAERCSVVHLLEAGKVIAKGEPRELLHKQHANNFDELFSKRKGTARDE
jgi:ABC-type multidrug transport system ATPase subunit